MASTTLSAGLKQKIVSVLLAALGVLTLAAVATWEPMLAGQSVWAPPNACGPVGAAWATLLVWTFGRAAAYGVTLLCAAWAWNRLRGHKAGPLVIRSLLGALLVFEICTLLGLGQLDRAAWTGAWGFAGALALRSALGLVGSWVVAGTLFAVTLLAASELGFHWIARLARRALVDPAVGLGTAWGEWREARAARGQAGPKPKGEGSPPGRGPGPRGARRRAGPSRARSRPGRASRGRSTSSTCRSRWGRRPSRSRRRRSRSRSRRRRRGTRSRARCRPRRSRR